MLTHGRRHRPGNLAASDQVQAGKGRSLRRVMGDEPAGVPKERPRDDPIRLLDEESPQPGAGYPLAGDGQVSTRPRAGESVLVGIGEKKAYRDFAPAASERLDQAYRDGVGVLASGALGHPHSERAVRPRSLLTAPHRSLEGLQGRRVAEKRSPCSRRRNGKCQEGHGTLRGLADWCDLME